MIRIACDVVTARKRILDERQQLIGELISSFKAWIKRIGRR